MDPTLRTLEREIAGGDLSKRTPYACALSRNGRSNEAIPIYLQLLREEPQNQDFMQAYLGAGGYCPVLREDEHLGASILHQNLPLHGETVDRVVGDEFLKNGDARTFDRWRTYVSRNKKGISIPSARDKTAIDIAMLGFIDLRTGDIHPVFRDVVHHHIENFRRHEPSWPLYGKITYGRETHATLEEFTIDRKVITRDFDIPTFPQNYTTLAREQRELNINPRTDQITQALAHLVGSPDEAVRAFQYFTARRNNNFREVVLWTPDQEGRQQISERALVLGYVGVGYDDGFGIYCYDFIDDDWPALGWRSAAKISNRQ